MDGMKKDVARKVSHIIKGMSKGDEEDKKERKEEL